MATTTAPTAPKPLLPVQSPVPPDIEIAQSIAPKHISLIAEGGLGLLPDEYELYGRTKAKVSVSAATADRGACAVPPQTALLRSASLSLSLSLARSIRHPTPSNDRIAHDRSSWACATASRTPPAADTVRLMPQRPPTRNDERKRAEQRRRLCSHENTKQP